MLEETRILDCDEGVDQRSRHIVISDVFAQIGAQLSDQVAVFVIDLGRLQTFEVGKTDLRRVFDHNGSDIQTAASDDETGDQKKIDEKDRNFFAQRHLALFLFGFILGFLRIQGFILF